jgi:hypothetical protein
MAKKIRENNIKANPASISNFGGYPIMYVFKTIASGGYKRVIQPCKTPSKAYIEYERGSVAT